MFFLYSVGCGNFRVMREYFDVRKPVPQPARQILLTLLLVLQIYILTLTNQMSCKSVQVSNVGYWYKSASCYLFCTCFHFATKIRAFSYVPSAVYVGLRCRLRDQSIYNDVFAHQCKVRTGSILYYRDQK